MSKIFILEDDPDRINWFNKKFDGHELTITASVGEACDKIKSNEYDIIFLDRDLSHPTETGEDVAWHMAEHKLAESTPVVIHSINERGQRVIQRYLHKYKNNVYSIPFKELKNFSQVEIFKKVSQTKTATIEKTEAQSVGQTSVFDALFNSVDFSDKFNVHFGIKNSRATAAKNLFQIWKDTKNKVGANIFRKPLELSLSDINNMEKEGLVSCVGDKIKITSNGAEVLKTMILGDDRCAFDADYNKPLDLRTAESNIIKKKKTAKGSQLKAEDNWWKDIFKK